MLRFIRYNWRSFFYSLLLCIGFILLVGIVENEPIRYFFYGSAILFLVLIIELVGLWYWSTRKLIQLNIPLVDNYDNITQLILHATLPSMLYWSIVAFIYNNINPHLWQIIIFLSWISFFVLFTNIRSYYEDKFKLEQKTHFIYDFIKYLIFFLASFSLIEFTLSKAINFYIIPTGLSLLSIFIVLLNLLRYKQVRTRNVSVALLGSVLIGFVAYLGMYYLNFYKLQVVIVLLFYILTSIIHHMVKNNLTKDIVVEYILVGLLLSTMFLF
jgi:hypothetical protein